MSGSRGPKSKSTSSKKIKFESGIPSAPAWLDAVAKAEYKRVSTILLKVTDHLQMVDMSVLSTYSQAYSDVCRLTKSIRDDDSSKRKIKIGEALISDKGNLYLNPKVGALGNAYARMEKAASKLGFSPADRERLEATNAKKESKLAQMMGNK